VTAPASYAVVTPARDEALNLPRLEGALAAQTHRPLAWVIVENGSTDDTLGIANEIAGRHDWARAISLTGEPVPTRGGPIARAFEAGLASLDEEPEVVVIVDGDVSMEPDYFELLMGKFAADPSLGMASGSRFEPHKGSWRRHQVVGTFTVEGQTRAYRMRCLPDVLPLDDSMGWDGIDAVKANLRGWTTRTFPDIEYRHHRLVGARDASVASARVLEGRGAYYMGYRPTYLVLRAFHHARREPAALGLIWGYVLEAVKRGPQYPDRDVIEFLRSEQSIRNLPARMREARGRTA
jgi:glycosyltransferase involved in cell wall biosynthesis